MTSVPGIGPGSTAEQRAWDDAAAKQRLEGLKTVRDAATGWEKSITGLLGVFGVVAAVKGPESLSDLPETTSVVVLTLAVLAASCLLAALVLAALASQGTPKWADQLDGFALRQAAERAATTGVRQLAWSRGLAVVAATLTLAAFAAAWASSLPSDEPTRTKVVVVKADGSAACGVLTGGKAGLELSPDGTTPGPAVGEVRQLVVVAACP